MEFVETIPVFFKEITPNQNIPEKWKEIVLNTGGTHSTLQDIKLPEKAGGYWYKESKKANTLNRFLYWQTTSDSIELSEASLDLNLTASHLRCKVAAGTPPLNNITVYERPASQDVVILAATVSSVHRLIFPHPESLDNKATFGSLSSSSLSIFHDTTAVNNPNNYYILNQYSNPSTGVAHTCASMLRSSGEAVFALAYGHGGEGGLLLVKLPVAGTASATLLKRESTVPRFLAGITGALRGKSGSDGIETYGVVLTQSLAVAVCGDTCLRAWALDEPGAPAAVSPPLSQTLARPKTPLHGHMLHASAATGGGVLLVAYLSFPGEGEFVALKMQEGAAGVAFNNVCRVFGPQLDLLDYTIGYGDGNHVIWAIWSQPDGETVITSSALGAGVRWRAVRRRGPLPPLAPQPSHQRYRDRLLAPGLFPKHLVHKALVIYRRTWGGAMGGGAGYSEPELGPTELGAAAVAAVSARLAHLAARAPPAQHHHLMHKCWSDLYSWCMQYMEGLQKPLGLMVSTHDSGSTGWWCGVVRRAGVALVRPLDPLQRAFLAHAAGDDLRDHTSVDGGEVGDSWSGALSEPAMRLVAAAALWERAATPAQANELERLMFSMGAPQHRLLPRLEHLLTAPHRDSPADQNDGAPTTLTPQEIDEITSVLEPIKDLQSAVLELNDALRLDVPEIDISKCEDEGTGEYDNLFASDLGVSVVTEAIRQMAEMRCRVVRGVVCAVCLARGAAGVPGAGHCSVHWQAYRALLWLHADAVSPPPPSENNGELFRLKLQALGAPAAATAVGAGRSVVAEYARGAGGRRARAHLAVARADPTWHHALPLAAYHLAHQLWAVSGGFEFGWWLATINQPRLVQTYVNMLEPWCEWNACSRQFILGLSLLDAGDAEAAYTAFCRAAKGAAAEPFLRRLIAAPDHPTDHHQATVLYYMKVIKLFEIHDAGACVVRLAETAISIADKDDPNLAMFQWLVFKWHLAGGRVPRALSAAAANPAPRARRAAAATLLTTLAHRRQLGALVSCGVLAAEAERAAAARARLLDAHSHNPYYDFLYALHVSRHHYRKAAAVMYERAARCGAEAGEGAAGAAAARRRLLAAALAALRLASPEHAFIARPARPGTAVAAQEPAQDEELVESVAPSLQVIGPEELAAELREEDPDSMDPVQQALLTAGPVPLESLCSRLDGASAAELRALTERALAADQFLPRWFLLRYMEVDAAGCVRALLAGGRAAEAAAACAGAVRAALCRLTAAAPPQRAPLAAADLALAELTHHLQDPVCKETYDDLNAVVQEYMQVVSRTSEDMKLARIKYAIVN